ncbi:MAG: hypothetical protein LBD18_06175 [Treponema sp.]|nr:hypothetical protein [Treponema sp.]
MEKHYSRKNVDMFVRNYELNKKVGVDKDPYVACRQNIPVKQGQGAWRKYAGGVRRLTKAVLKNITPPVFWKLGRKCLACFQ